MEELTYKNIMTDPEQFQAWLTSDTLKETICSVERIDTAGAQIIIGLIQQSVISLTDLSEALQNELIFLGVA